MPATLSRLRADHLERPLALRRATPRLTWQIGGDGAPAQAAYRVIVAPLSDGATHDTG